MTFRNQGEASHYVVYHAEPEHFQKDWNIWDSGLYIRFSFWEIPSSDLGWPKQIQLYFIPTATFSLPPSSHLLHQIFFIVLNFLFQK